MGLRRQVRGTCGGELRYRVSGTQCGRDLSEQVRHAQFAFDLLEARLRRDPAEAEKVLDEARHFRHAQVGTEHLLLGLLREQEGVAAQVLVNMGLRLQDVREEVLELLGQTIDEEAEVTVLESPIEIQQTIRDLDAQIEQLNREKEQAVAESDFEKAALLRDRPTT